MVLVLALLMTLRGDFGKLLTYIINLYFSFSSQSSTNMFDRQFTLSFSADGYLYTEALFSRSGNLLEILIKPFSTEGLVMFAYDEQVSLKDFFICKYTVSLIQTRVSLEIHYRMGNLVVIFNGNESISMIER